MESPEIFCVLPWVSVQVRPDGRMAACCHSQTPYRTEAGEDLHLLFHSLHDAFHSPSAEKLRKNLLAGIRDRNCQSCWSEEARGQRSKRQFDFSDFREEAKAILAGNYSLDQPLYLDLGPGNFCNLKCRICHAGASSSWEKETADLGLPREELPPAVEAIAKAEGTRAIRAWAEPGGSIWREIEAWLPRIRKFNFVGGEPFLNKGHFELLAKSVQAGHSRGQSVQYNTNGTVYPERALREILPHFQSTQIWFSFDGIGERFEYQRHGAKWSRVLENLDRFLAHDFVSYAVCVTVSALNIYYLEEILEFWRSRGVKVYLGMAIGDGLSASCLPVAAKAEILRHLERIDADRYASILVNRLDPVLELLKTAEEPANWQQFQTSLRLHDEYRQESYAKVFPEAARIYGEKGFAIF